MADQGASQQDTLGQPAPGDARPAEGGLGGGADGVDAYEADWYRSLKALAARFVDDEEEEDEEAPEVSEDTAGDAEPAEEGPTDVPEAAAPVPETEETPAAEAQPDTTPPSEAPAPAAAPEDAPAPSLDSPEAQMRRRALVDLAERGVTASDVERVLELTMDPAPDVRRHAVAALAPQADLLPDGAVVRMLQDPNDEVRSQAVHLASLRGSRELAHLLVFVGDRRSPLTQAAALEVLPDLVAQDGGPSEDQLTTALGTVAKMDAHVNETERGPLAELARGIGVGRLVEMLAATDDRRLGAARLLGIEQSIAALRGLAGLRDDPLEEIRLAAEEAASHVEEMERATVPQAPAADSDPAAGSSPVEQAAENEMIAALAKTLEDPDDAVRERATAALSDVDRIVIVAWVREALGEEDPELARHAAGVAELRGLTEVAPELLDRGSSMHGERQETFRRVLSSLPLETETLVGGLTAVDPVRRPEAIHLLWQVAGRAALPMLQQSLTDPSPDVRTAVLHVLSLSDDSPALDAASRVLSSDSSPVVRATAVEVLARGAAEQRLASLTLALDDPDPSVRAAAVSGLTAGLGRDALEPLTKALDDLDERVWHSALPHLVSLPTEDMAVVWRAMMRARPEQRDALFGALEHADSAKVADLALQHVQAPDPGERELAIGLAGRGKSEACIQACVQALQDPVASVRRQAAGALRRLKSPSAAQALGASLADPDPEVRIGAVQALGVIDSEAVLGFLVAALQDPSADVREAASAVLTEWSSPAVARRLAGVLATPARRDQAMDLLAKMGPSATELLVDVLLQSSPEMKPTVGDILERIVGVDHFTERLRSPDPHQRRRALIASAAIGGPNAVELAVGALADPDQHVRAAALGALGELHDPRTADAVGRCAESDPVPEVAEAARRVLALLRPGS